MGKILFLGNGLNQVSSGGLSWSDLLNKMQIELLGESDKLINAEKPFTLWFEEFIARSNDDVNTLKSNFIKKLGEIQPNTLHGLALNSGIENIITTNYDYCLERAINKEFSSNPKITAETTFSLFRHQEINNQLIWHIHGEVSKPGSVMLGMNHYSRYLHKIRDFLKNPVEKNKIKYRSKFNHNEKHSEFETTQCWVDLFLEHDVHMIGFGMDYTEQDIWYLLTEKNFLSKQNRTSGKTFFYHFVTNDKDSEQDQKNKLKDDAKIEILESLGVTIIKIIKNKDDYAGFYEDCLEQIQPTSTH